MEKAGKKPNKPLYIVLAILIAVALWAYVRGVDDQDQQIVISNVSVTYVGEDVLNASSLMRAEGEEQTVDLQLEGKWAVLSRLNRDNMSVRVDLQNIAAPGEYSLPYTIVYPTGVSTASVRVLSRTPEYISVPIALQSTKNVELEGVCTAQFAEGYVSDGGFVFQPASIQVSGEATAVAEVAFARVTISRDEPISKTIQDKMNFELIGQDGEVLNKENFTIDPETVNVTYAVTMERENVPLEVEFYSGGGVSKDQIAEPVIEPASVTLRGSEEALQLYPVVQLGTVDLNRVYRGENGMGVVECPIVTESGVRVVGDITQATVTVDLRGFAEQKKTIAASRIQTLEPEGELAGYEIEPNHTDVVITLRGSQAEYLEQLARRDMKIVIDPNDTDNIKALKQGGNSVTLYGRVQYADNDASVFEALDARVDVKVTRPAAGESGS